MLKPRLILALLTLGIAPLACKPPTEALLLESGGDAVSWKLRASLSSTFALNLTTTSTAADDHIKTVTLKIEGSPDGGVATSALKSREWMPLTNSSAADLSLTILATIAKGSVCYANSAKLNQVDLAVACKGAGGGPLNDTSGAEKAKAVCQRLSTTKIGASSENFAILTSNQASFCTCLNGVDRELYFRAYDAPSEETQFENTCKAVGTETDHKMAILQKHCVELEQKDDLEIDVDPTLCMCGTKKLNYDSSEYLDRPDFFRSECTRLARETATGNDEFRRFREACTSVGGRSVGLTACDCGKEQVKFETFMPSSGDPGESDLTRFKDGCREKLREKAPPPLDNAKPGDEPCTAVESGTCAPKG